MQSLLERIPACLMHRLALPSAAPAVGRARGTVRQVLGSWGLRRLDTDASLVVSELVGNAVQHARDDGTGLVLSLSFSGRRLRIEVRDADPRPPRLSSAGVLTESGFGLRIVAELASSWGVDEVRHGKRVWAELTADVPGTGPQARPAACDAGNGLTARLVG